MTNLETDRFRIFAPMQCRELIDPDHLESIDDYGDYALLTYDLAVPLPIEQVMNKMEDNLNLNILYHVRTSSAEDAGHHCCAYRSPSHGSMYKFNAQAGADGLVRTVYVHIFESLEVMLEYLKEDLLQHTQSCVVKASMSYPRLIADFM